MDQQVVGLILTQCPDGGGVGAEFSRITTQASQTLNISGIMLLLKSDCLTQIFLSSRKKGTVLVKRTTAKTTCHRLDSSQAFSRQRLGRSGLLSRRHFQADWETLSPEDQGPKRWVKKLSYHPQTGSLQAYNTERNKSVPAWGLLSPRFICSPHLW